MSRSGGARGKTVSAPMPSLRHLPLLAGTTGAALMALYLAVDDARMAALWGIGLLLGVTLYHAGIGFTGAYRRWLLRGEVREIRAQLLMLAVATLLFAPVLAAGEVLGQSVAGALAPVGVSMFFGAFLFGIGMQLAGGCGSGTLHGVGNGSLRMLVVLVAFCVGGFWASLHLSQWQRLPEWAPQALGAQFGWARTALVQAGALLVAWWWLRSRDVPPPDKSWRFWRGPWPLMAGAVMLALLNATTLVVAGHPWTITWAFTLWAAKAAQWVGWNAASSTFWSAPFQNSALQSGILTDITSVMDLGLILGAALAAMLAGRFTFQWHIPLASLLAAVLGGLAIGYGARLSYGCNIGAFFSGVASTSLHGWVWIIAALLGTSIGVRLRPCFGLHNERPS